MRARHRNLCICTLMLSLFLATDVTATQEVAKQPANANAQQASPEGLEKGLPADPIPEPSASTSRPPGIPVAPPNNSQLNDSTRAEYQKALQAYYDYHRSGLEHRKKVFEWQLLSSKIIFVVVIILVLSGVYFSSIQFHSSLRAARYAEERMQAYEQGVADGERPNAPEFHRDESVKDEYPITHLEASLQGIKVSSPVLGVIILALSFLFFYLYLKYVYPINEIF